MPKIKCWFLIILGVWGVSGCSLPLVKTLGNPSKALVLKKDTTWAGVVIVRGEVFIPQGVTLTIRPGTIIRFQGRPRVTDELKRHDIIDGAGLKLEGKIIALGTKSWPIFFTSNQTAPTAGDWDKILMNNTQGSQFDHCYFEYADYAIHAHFAAAAIKNSVIRYNNEGLRLGESRLIISHSSIEKNRSRGINCRKSRDEISHNEITGNGVGIFLFEEDQDCVIKENNIYRNQDYDLRLGDFHAGDILLKSNWWGTTHIEEIAEKIWDNADDEAIGKALIQPAAQPWETRQ